tara:strand:- start:268 stop:1794 length:1527 start_codon:yes stop_codon:yes gene_type:complete
MRNYEVYSSAYLASALAQQQLKQAKLDKEYEREVITTKDMISQLARDREIILQQLGKFSDTGSVSHRTAPLEIETSPVGPDLKNLEKMQGSFVAALRVAKLQEGDVGPRIGQVMRDGKARDATVNIANAATKNNSKKQAVASFQQAARATNEIIASNPELGETLKLGFGAALEEYNKLVAPGLQISGTDMSTPQVTQRTQGGTSTTVTSKIRDPTAVARLEEELDLVNEELQTYRKKLTDMRPEEAELQLGRGNPYLQPLQNLREYRQTRDQARRLREMSDEEKAVYSALRRYADGERPSDKDPQMYQQLLQKEDMDYTAAFKQLDAIKGDMSMDDALLGFVETLMTAKAKQVDLGPAVEAQKELERKSTEAEVALTQRPVQSSTADGVLSDEEADYAARMLATKYRQQGESTSSALQSEGREERTKLRNVFLKEAMEGFDDPQTPLKTVEPRLKNYKYAVPLGENPQIALEMVQTQYRADNPGSDSVPIIEFEDKGQKYYGVAGVRP